MIGSLISFIAAHPHLAYAGVFLLSLSESLPIIGAVVPGSTIIVATAALVPTGAVHLWPLLAAAFIGAVVGDGAAFWIGHRYKRSILELPAIRRRAELVQGSEAFFSRHGNKSVFIARFTPGVRAFIPLLAGTLGMSPARFYLANVASALIYAPAHILPGVAVGASLSAFGAAAKPLGILIVLLLLLIWVTTILIRIALRHGPAMAIASAERARLWADSHESRAALLVRTFLDPSRPDIRWLALLGAVLVAAAALFLGILEDVVSGDPLVRTDTAVYDALQHLRTPVADRVMTTLTELGDTTVVIAVAAAVFLWFASQRAWRIAVYWLAAVGGASLLNSVIKAILHRPRPGQFDYTGWSAFSFPSGHSTTNLVLYGFLAFLIARDARPAMRLPIAFFAGTFILLIAFSRLYLGAHWFSDVVGGLAFGTVWLLAVIMSFLRRQTGHGHAFGLALVGCGALLVAGGIHVRHRHTDDLTRYATQWQNPTMTESAWWAEGWQQLPGYRIGLTGEREEPLTVQWAGSAAEIERMLSSGGWTKAPQWTWHTASGWLTPNADPSALPVMPEIESGRLPAMTFIRMGASSDTASSRLVLRLWQTDWTLADGSAKSLWLGSVVQEDLTPNFRLIVVPSTDPDMNRPRDALKPAIAGANVGVRERSPMAEGWDGQVLLLVTG